MFSGKQRSTSPPSRLCCSSFSVSVLNFPTSPNSGVKFLWRFLRSEKSILRFIFFSLCVFFLVFSFLLLSRTTAFHDHGILPDDTRRQVQQKTLSRDYRRRVRARLLEIRDPLRQRWDDLWLRHLHPWLSPSHLPHTCRLCGKCDTVSSAASTGANRCARCAQVAACPWPEPPAGPRRRTEEEALHLRMEGAHTPSHERAGPAGAALLWIHVHLRDPTTVAHLSHVFAP